MPLRLNLPIQGPSTWLDDQGIQQGLIPAYITGGQGIMTIVKAKEEGLGYPREGSEHRPEHRPLNVLLLSPIKTATHYISTGMSGGRAPLWRRWWG